MSGKDETDLVRNKEITTSTPTTDNETVPNKMMNQVHDISNGDSSIINGKLNDQNNENTNEPIERKSTTPSNWVQFENEDDSDKKVPKNIFISM